MPEPLKNHLGPAIPKKIAGMISSKHKAFRSKKFLCEALEGYDALNLTGRAWHIARVLRRHLPDDYTEAIDILMTSLGPKLDGTVSFGMSPFLYLPHVFFVAEFGLEHFEPSMRAQYELTQRFTAEFSIRAYIERHRDATLARLKKWASDPSSHVRRLVSEGTRPRLPWASRLRDFQRDPRPVLALLEFLKDDPELYVRRSVANNLNDIGKDHPELLAETAARWLQDASLERHKLVQHALRSAVKRGETRALKVLGFGGKSHALVQNVKIDPASPRIGSSVTIAFDVENTASTRARILVDLRIHFVKASGKASAKVFKLKSVQLGAGAPASFKKKIALHEMTTRKHYPGRHAVEALLNGSPYPVGHFDLRSAH